MVVNLPWKQHPSDPTIVLDFEGRSVCLTGDKLYSPASAELAEYIVKRINNYDQMLWNAEEYRIALWFLTDRVNDLKEEVKQLRGKLDAKA